MSFRVNTSYTYFWLSFCFYKSLFLNLFLFVKPFCQQKSVAINHFWTHLSSLYLTYFIDNFQILDAVHGT